MEALGIGLQALGSAIGSIAAGMSTVCVVGIISAAVLIYFEKITIADLKELFKKDKWK
jgi:hypothetical protein